ncbi:MAG: hypothetical protein KDJ62_03340 [Rhodobiaceae bacterium]|nr:hypothetical protein [Rhodobiaceae bacterium]MCC0049318.1 hypothetical protein [Rhodobiaceae bacterium]
MRGDEDRSYSAKIFGKTFYFNTLQKNGASFRSAALTFFPLSQSNDVGEIEQDYYRDRKAQQPKQNTFHLILQTSGAACPGICHGRRVHAVLKIRPIGVLQQINA